VMAAYNAVNGTTMTEHPLQRDVLKREWGFDGLVMSDWGAVHDRVAALAAGLDLEMPPDLEVSAKALVDAVSEGSLDESVLDESVARLRRLVERAGRRRPAEVDVDAHHALARRAAAESVVLLKNDGGVLPLADTPGRTVAVVGELARTPRFQGAGSSQVNPTRVDVPLDELAAALPSTTVRFAGDTPAEAARGAQGADVVVAFLGLPLEAESEGFDRTHIDLPSEQLELLSSVAGLGAPVVVVLANGSVLRTSPWDHQAAAVLECWLGGQAAGGAIADVLTGAVNPSGRLTETIPLRLQDSPSFLNFPGEQGHVRYGEGVFVGYRGFDAAELPVAYPFGHGLSYTAFEYRDLQARADAATVTVSCTVANIGEREGREVVQLYVGDPEASVARPPRELKRFAKVSLAPGASQQITFVLDERDLAFWSTLDRRWVVEPGAFEIAVGASSRDLRLRMLVDVSVAPPARPLTAMSTLAEWLADPEGGKALRAEVGVGADGRPAGVLGDDELLRVIGGFPLSTLAAFPGGGISHDLVRRLTE
jgi:beta-glucosidase